jgi:predicted dehydrogenase
VQKAKELMPRLGHLMSVYCRTYQGGGRSDPHTGKLDGHFIPGPDGKSPIVRMAGGGVLVCGGSHLYDLLLFLVGKPRRVYARQFRRPQESDCDFMTHALLDLEGGGFAHFEGNWHPLFRIGYQNRGWDEGFEISGVNGRLILQTPIWNQPEHDAPVLKHYDNETGTWTEHTFDIVCPFGQAERHFLSQLAKGEQGPQDRYTGYRTDYLLESTQKSATLNQPLDLHWEA